MNLLRIPRAVQNIQRFRQIAGVLIEYGFDELVIQAGIADRWYLRNARRAELTNISTPVRFAAMLERLGPSFIKLGQVLSTRADILPEAWVTALQRLQDTVKPLDFATLRSTVEAATGPLTTAFAVFDETPLATASVSQVHAATLPSGEKVVVKIVRPGMREQVLADVQLMRVFAQLAEQQIPELQAFRPTGVIAEFERAIIKEMDLRRELRNIERFRKNFAAQPQVVIPQVYAQLSNANVLVMERLEGVRITDYHKVGADPVALARLGVEIVFQMAFFDGFFHADPHPGNIWALPGNKIGLLDMGMADFVIPETRDTLVDLLAAIATDDPDRLVAALSDLGELPADLNRKAFKRDVLLLYEEHIRGAKLAEINMGSLLAQAIDIGRRHRIIIPTDITMMLKGLGTMEGIGKQLYPDLDIVSEARPHVLKLLGLRWGPERLAKQVVGALTKTFDLVVSLPERAENVLHQVETGQFRTRSEIIGLERHVALLAATGNRIAAGLIVLSLTVAAAALWQNPIWQVRGIPVLAIVAATAATVVGLGLLLSMWRARQRS